MNKRAYLGLSVLELSKILMYDFWYVYVKTKYNEKACVIKRNLKFKNYKNCLEETQLEKKIKYLEKNKTVKASIKKIHKDFINHY